MKLKKDGSIEVETPNRYSYYKIDIPKSLRLIKDCDEYIDRMEKQAEYRRKGLCQHCGGILKKGWFSTKCTSCGMKKDYE